MAKLAIVVSETKGGLIAVAGQKYRIIPETVTEFEKLTTRTSPELTNVGVVDTAGSGWIALAIKV